MTRDRYRVVSHSPHFITCTTVDWVSVFRIPLAARIILDSLVYLQDNNSWTLYGYVLMENHVHIIVSSRDLPVVMKSFKSFTAKAVINLLEDDGMTGMLDRFRSKKAAHKKESEYQFWQEGYHPEMIIDREMMKRKLRYVHNNPVRRGYVDQPEHWRYSSARDYCDEEGLIALNGKGKW